MENAPSDGSPTQNGTNKKIETQNHLGNFGFKYIVKISGKHAPETFQKYLQLEYPWI